MVGFRGSGSLSIAKGGQVLSGEGFIGNLTKATGSVTVAGNWINSGDIRVGSSGSGSLTIEQGGAVSNIWGMIGLTEDATGVVTVDGTWSSGRVLQVGLYGSGSLTIARGGTVSANVVTLAEFAGSTGVLTIGAAQGELAVAPGTLTSATLQFGAGAGRLVFNHTDSAYVFAPVLSGAGEIAVLAGTTRLTGNSAAFTGPTRVNGGVLEVTGRLGGSNVFVGDDSSGSLTITQGGAVSNIWSMIGRMRNATGVVTVDGTWTNSGFLSVGYAGNGSLTIAQGGTVSASAVSLADFAGSTGVLTIGAAQGAAAVAPGTLTSATLQFGAGAGRLVFNHTDSAYVFAPVLSGAGEIAVLAGTTRLTGDSAAFTGPTRVNGGVLEVTGRLGSSIVIVGNDSSGSLTIAQGGSVSNYSGFIGVAHNAIGTVTVAGSWTNSGNLSVGYSGSGSLTIAQGGAVSSHYGYIGDTGSGTGTALVAGTWTNIVSLAVGNFGSGSLTIAQGGTVSASAVLLAEFARSTGVLTIGAAQGAAAVAPGTLTSATLQFGAGAGRLVFNHTDSAYVLAPVLSGAGEIAVLAGTTRLTGDSAGFTGAAQVAGGVLDVAGTLGGASSTLHVSDAGALRGAGRIGGAVQVAGGRLIGSAGTTLAMASLTLDAQAQIDVHLGAASSTALFDVAGALTLDGTLNIMDAGGFGAGIYRLIDYRGPLSDHGLEIGARPAGTSAQDLWLQTAVAQQVNLVSTFGEELWFWDGAAPGAHDNGQVDGGSGAWTASNRNWTNASGALNAAFGPTPGFAVFQGAAGTVTIAGKASVTGLQFATDGYLLTGDELTLADAGGRSALRVGDGSAAGAAYTATIAAAVTGANALVKEDLGTLILTGANSYSGGTVVAAGRLIGDASTLRGDIATSGQVVFAQNDTASFAGALSGAGLAVKEGAGRLQLTGASTVDWSVTQGALQAEAAQFGGDLAIAAPAAVQLTAAHDATYAGTLSGAGQLIKTGAGSLTYGGDGAGFTGAAQVAGGVLRIASGSRLGGSLAVQAGATLAGAGTVGHGAGAVVTIGADASLAPGSRASLTIDGDLVLQDGARFLVETDPMGLTSDRVIVTGTAQLAGGAVAHIAARGDYNLRQRYTILSAGALQGEFAAVTSDFAFLRPSLSYDQTAGTVVLALTRTGRRFADLNVTRNQGAVGGALDSMDLEAGHPVIDTMIQMPDDPTSLAEGLDMLSGEGHSTIQSQLLTHSLRWGAGLSARLRGGQSAAGNGNGNEAGAGQPSLTKHPFAEGVQFWAYGYGIQSDSKASADVAASALQSSGLVLGADIARAEWHIGLLGSYGTSDIRIPDRATAGQSESAQFGLYGTTQQGGFDLNAALVFGHHAIETTRRITLPGLRETLTASYAAQSWQLVGGGAYPIQINEATQITPFADLAYISLTRAAAQERGGAAALHLAEETTQMVFGTLGLRTAQELHWGGTPARVHGMLGWRHGFDVDEPQGRHHFAMGDVFTVAGAALADDSLLFEGGIDLDIDHGTGLSLTYSGAISSRAQSYGFSIEFNKSF